MARIRSIKPEFWTDEKIVQLPFEARLLFVGLWNFCDDDGRLYDEPERIRLQVLPSDQIDIELLLDLLVAAGLIERLILDDGSGAIVIPRFCDHQKISHKTPSRISLENSGKLRVPAAVRRAVATKYGCKPGGDQDAQCYYCGAPGRMRWWPLPSGKPSGWVSFSGLELDHFVAEVNGGQTDKDNIVLACRECNRSKHDQDALAFIERHNFRKIPEPSGSVPESARALRPEGKGEEGKGREGSRGDAPAGKYAFVGRIVRLTPRDFEGWRKAYHTIPDLAAELTAIDDKFSRDPPKDWFGTASAWLRTKHERLLAEQASKPKPERKPKAPMAGTPEFDEMYRKAGG